MKIPFTGYVHGSIEDGYCRAEDIADDYDLTDEDKRAIAYAFYEVRLDCVYDTETGQVTLVHAKL